MDQLNKKIKLSHYHISTNLVQTPFIGANTFNQRNGEWIQLISLMRLVDDGQWYSESHSLKIADFLVQRYDLGQKIDLQLQDISTAGTRSMANI